VSLMSGGAWGAWQRMGILLETCLSDSDGYNVECGAGEDALGGPRARRVIIRPCLVIGSLHVMLGD